MGAQRRLGWEIVVWGTLIAASLVALLFGLFVRQGGLVPTGDERILGGDVTPRAVVTETTFITRTDLFTVENFFTQTSVVNAQVAAASILLTDAEVITDSDVITTAVAQPTQSAIRIDEPPPNEAATPDPANTRTGRLLGLWIPLGSLLVSVFGLVTNVLFELRRDVRDRRDLAHLADRRQREIDKLELEIQLLRGDLDAQPFDEDDHSAEEPWIFQSTDGRSQEGEFS